MAIDYFVGSAKADNQSDFPISITLDNVTVRLESIEINKRFDCSSCFYMNQKNHDICSNQKDLALKPAPQKPLCATAILVHIINASESDIDFYSSSWVMIDSDGYKFEASSPCSILLSRRIQSPETVLSSTQAKHLVLFPELEDGIIPSLFLLKVAMREYRFVVGELSEEIRYTLKPPKPRDSLTDKKKAYIKSDSYGLFIRALREENIELEQDDFDYVVANLASNYYSYVGNSNNVWDNEKYLIENYPMIVSLAEIVSFQCAQKTVITISSSSLEPCKAIIEKYCRDYKLYPIHVLGQDIIAITIIQVFNSDDKIRTNASIGGIIWDEIEDSRIKCGICSLTKRISNLHHPDQVYLSGGRELDLSDLSRNANAGYREDLRESFRSSWEANVARVLKMTKHKYKYEEQTYEMKKYTYLPDFTLEDGTVIEVKGIWDVDSLGKVAEFHKTYPEIEFLTLDSELYYDLNKKYCNSINWERSSISIHNNIISVVGLSFVSDQTVFESLEIDSKIMLVREPENKYDKYAILVEAVDGRPIGHVSSEWAVVYAPKMDAGAKYKATIKEIAPKVIKAEVVRTNTDQEVIYDCLKVQNKDGDSEEQYSLTLF